MFVSHFILQVNQIILKKGKDQCSVYLNKILPSITHPDCVKVFDTRVFLGAVVGPHVNAVVELPEAFLPRVVRVALVRRYELELAWGGVHQGHVILKH